MKQFLRIAIVVLIMVAMGFGGYALFFKPANKDEVYLALSKVPELEYSDTDLTSEKVYADSVKNISAEKFSPVSGMTYRTSYNGILDNYRGLLTFSTNLTEIKIPRLEDDEKKTNDNGIEQYTYPELKSKLDNVFNYYLAYSQAVSKKIPKSTLKNIKKLIKTYESSFNNLIDSLDSIKSLQTYINQEFTENSGNQKDYSAELEKRYQASIVSFRNYITDYVNLIQEAKNFVSEYVFDGEMITDKESLLHDLMLESLKKATSQAYGFDNNVQLNAGDDYMASATQIVTLATDKITQNNLSDIKKYSKDSVTYKESETNALYYHEYEMIVPIIELTYNKVELTLRLENVLTDTKTKKALYIGDTNIVAVDGAESGVTIDDDGSVTASGNKRAPKETFEENGKKYCKFVCYVNINGENANKLCFFDEDNEYCDINSYVATTLENDVQPSGNQVIFTNGVESVSYSYTTLVKKYCKLNVSGYGYFEVTDDGEIISLNSSGEHLEKGFSRGNGNTGLRATRWDYSDGVYHKTAFYSDENYSCGSEYSWLKEALSYTKMIKCYNKIMSEDASIFTKIIELTTKQKVDFVKGNMSVRASFVEVLHDDIEYLLACCGFYK